MGLLPTLVFSDPHHDPHRAGRGRTPLDASASIVRQVSSGWTTTDVRESLDDGKALQDVVGGQASLLLAPDDEDLSSMDDLVVCSPGRHCRPRVHSRGLHARSALPLGDSGEPGSPTHHHGLRIVHARDLGAKTASQRARGV
jgi:hypothetical protein